MSEVLPLEAMLYMFLGGAITVVAIAVCSMNSRSDDND